ncbi:MAG: hypothetical protein U0929_15950 [Planctomycetaceae bacterium]
MGRQLVLLLLAVVCFYGQVARAQENPLKISVRSEWEGVRTSAPISVRAYLKWPKNELLEGHLQFNTFVDQQKISHWTSPETALSASEQYLRFMTPRPVLEGKYDRYVLEAEFFGKNRLFPPEQLDIEVPLRQKRAMVVAVVLDNRSPTPTGLYSELSLNPYERPLSLQGYLSGEEVSDLEVYQSRVNPVDLPTESLRYLGLDALLLSHDTLDVLRPNQLESLRTWIVAGGSLALIQTGELRDDAEVFVKDLMRNAWTIEQVSARKLPDSVQVYSPGLGQFIHVTERQRGESSEWARVAHLLLRLTPDRANEIGTSGQLKLRSDPRGLGEVRGIVQTEPVIEGPMEPLARFSYSALSRALIPDTIRGMPFWLAASVLAGCLICVGPVDYFLLGAIRKRRWTWAFFPVVALSFTGWMAHLAAEHNGRNDSRNWLSVVDLTPDNEVVRTSRIELTYGASGRTVQHEVKNQWWTDLKEEDLRTVLEKTTEEYTRTQNRFASRAMNRSAAYAGGERLSYMGNVPGHYLVYEPVRQWAPRMQRITTLGADPELAEFYRPQLSWAQLTASDPQKVNEYLQKTLPPEWQTVWWKIQSPRRNLGWNQLQKNRPIPDHMNDVLKTVADMLGESWRPVDRSASVTRMHRGVFSLVTELAPTAGPDCEDLVITSRPTLVMVNEVAPGRFLAYRVVMPPE